MTSLMSSHKILDKHAIVDMISHHISHLRLHLCAIPLRNPLSQSKSMIVYVYP